MKKNSVVITSDDSIAVCTSSLKKGEVARMFIGISEKDITVINDIPFGHKIAIKQINKGHKIIKYGESIGVATQAIQIGEWVHIHNVESERGRGDKK